MKRRKAETPGTASDAALLARFNAGEVQALAELVERHNGGFYRFALDMTGQAADAQDVVQEVWRRVVKKAAGFRGESFRGWLFRICRNHLIDRARMRRPNVSLDEPLGEDGTTLMDVLPAGGATPGQAVEGAEWRERLGQAVAGLSPKQREVFLLRAEGMPFREIAGVQRVSINTALARMHYAVGKLQRMLRKDFGAEAR